MKYMFQCEIMYYLSFIIMCYPFWGIENIFIKESS